MMAALMVMAGLATAALAGVDKAQGNITPADWTGASSVPITQYYVDATTNKPVPFPNRRYLADSGLTLGHVLNEDADDLAHYHSRYEWGGANPAASRATVYWNERFNGPLCSWYSGDADTQHQTCHEWALTESGNSTGTYTYTLTGAAGIYGAGEDVEKLDNRNNVQADDIMLYISPSAGGHSTLVINVVDPEGCDPNSFPGTVRWKWLDSPIYQYSPFNVPDEFDTPFKTGAVDTTKTITNQGWVWDVDFMDYTACETYSATTGVYR